MFCSHLVLFEYNDKGVKTKEIDCTYKKYDGYIVDSVLSEKDKVTFDLLFYNY